MLTVLIVLGCWLGVSVLAAAVWAVVGGLVAQPPSGVAAAERRILARVPDDDARSSATDTPRAG